MVLSGFNVNAFGKQKDVQHVTTIVIDPGHGGKDPGTVVNNAKEKNIVLDIALKLGSMIKANLKNIKIVYTRDGDYFIPLMDRALIANKLNADLFISIHANYCKSPEIYGTETYVLGLHRTEDNLEVAKKENSVILLEDDFSKRYEGFNPNLSESYIMFELIQDTHLDQSIRFASILQSNFKTKAQRNDRDVRQAGFLVLRETAMPSVLIETGYLSNKKENNFLLTDDGRSEISKSIYESLSKYLDRIDLKAQMPEPKVSETRKADKQPEPVASSAVTINHDSASQRNKANSAESVPAKPGKAGSKNEKPTGNISREDNTKMNTSTENKVAETKSTDNKTTYAVQIGLFSKRIDPDSKVFEGLKPVREIAKNGRYKYLCFEYESFEKTKVNLPVVTKRFPDAFIVIINNGQIKYFSGGSAKK
jgi:N-acetylmuramoyl-L-alanine amidase